MFNRMKAIAGRVSQSKAAQVALVSGVALSSISAHAAIDVSSVTTALTDAGAAIAIVGLAYLAMSVGAKVFKWVKTAF